MRDPSGILGTAFLLVCLSGSSSVRAEPIATKRNVSVAIHGSEPDAGVLSATIDEILARLGLTPIEPVDGGTAGLLASVEIDLSEEGAQVTVRSAGGAIVVARQLHDPSREIQRERIAEAVLTATEAQLLSQDAELMREPAEHEIVPATLEPSASPARPHATLPVTEPKTGGADAAPREATGRGMAEHLPRVGHLALDISALIGAGPIASNAQLTTRVGGSATLVSRSGLHPFLTLSGLYAFPSQAGPSAGSTSTASGSQVESYAGSASIGLESARMIAGIRAFHSSWMALDIGLGGGIDVLTAEMSGAPGTSTPAARFTSIEPMVSGTTAVRFPIVSNLVLDVSAALDVDLGTRRGPSVIQTGYSVNQNMLPALPSPLWMVRPMLVAGLSFTAIGSSPFAQAPYRTPSRGAASSKSGVRSF